MESGQKVTDDLKASDVPKVNAANANASPTVNAVPKPNMRPKASADPKKAALTGGRNADPAGVGPVVPADSGVVAVAAEAMAPSSTPAPCCSPSYPAER